MYIPAEWGLRGGGGVCSMHGLVNVMRTVISVSISRDNPNDLNHPDGWKVPYLFYTSESELEYRTGDNSTDIHSQQKFHAQLS